MSITTGPACAAGLQKAPICGRRMSLRPAPTSAGIHLGLRLRTSLRHSKVVNASSSSGTPVGGSTSEGLNPRDFNQAIRQQTENRNQNNQDVHRRESNVRRPQQSDWDNEGDDDVEPHGGWRVFVSLGTFLAGFFLVWKVKAQAWPTELSMAVLLISWAALRVGNFLEVVVRTQTPFLRRAQDRDLGRTSSSAALAAEWGLWGATVALLLVTKHALGPWWGTIGLLGATLAVDSLFLQVGLNRRAEAVIARELKEDSLTEEQREELRALKQRTKNQGEEPSSTYLAKIVLDSLRTVVTAIWAYRICDRLAIVARIAAGVV